ncbi:uncharacterized protein LOC143293577 isoform X10 [Babylonia areolata]|uniref:uncharacterized protein LOC143293577 isoform X10 n=1 Tax=Babylonia areolata TaxID=304850 RepID=UPI003FD191CA
MDEESSTKFMGSLTKFLQSLCNGYVEFEDGVELIGHIYLSVDAGKTGKKLNYFLNEKVCKNDNSVTFISNSFHAQPEGKAKGQSGKDGEGKKDDEVSETSESVPKSTNAGTVPLRTPMSSRSAPSPNQSRSGVQTGTKRPGSPLSAPTPPSQRRMQSSVKSSVGSPVSKTVPSSPSSSSQDNIPSPSPARKNRSEISQPPSNQSDNASIDNESDIVPSNIMTINPPPDFASFIGSLTSDNQTSRDQRSPPDMKPDTDVTFIKEEFVSEPSSCAQTGSSGQSGRSGDDLYPVMLHQNTSVFPSTSSAYPSATATSQHPGFPGASTSQSDPFNPQDGADPSGVVGLPLEWRRRFGEEEGCRGSPVWACSVCGAPFLSLSQLLPHVSSVHGKVGCPLCGEVFNSRQSLCYHQDKRHRRREELRCSICGKMFTRMWTKKKHMETVHHDFFNPPPTSLDHQTSLMDSSTALPSGHRASLMDPPRTLPLGHL